jgi:hypothetical protein
MSPYFIFHVPLFPYFLTLDCVGLDVQTHA